MKIYHLIHGAATLLLLQSTTSFAQEMNPVISDDLGVTPYLYHQPCELTVDPRGFEVYANKNCDVLFIGPRKIEKPQNTIDLMGTIELCDGDKDLMESLNERAKAIKIITQQATKAVLEGKDSKAEQLYKNAETMRQQLTKNQIAYAQFSSIHGSTVSSVFNNSISGQDIYDFIAQNMLIFLNNPNPPKVAKLSTENSIYSFTHYRPEDAGAHVLSIISTTIPGLEILKQPTAAQTNVAHVKTDDIVFGETRLSLMSTCAMLEKKNDQWVRKNDDVQNVMTVNRSYDVPMKVGYGIEAHLKSDLVTTAISDILLNATENGLSKTQVYNKTSNLVGTEAFSVVIDGDIALSDEQRQELELDIRQRLMDRFLLYFEKNGSLASLTPVELPIPTGGEVPIEYIGTKCWSKSSMFGLSKKGGCYDYVYTVKEWRPGMSKSDIKDIFTISTDISEKIHVNDIIKVPMSSAFVDQVKTQEENKELL